jgi:two-component system chemotaxis response regulator CheB
VILAASLGGVAAYGAILPLLPGDFPAPVLVVQHRRPDEGLFEDILRRSSLMSVLTAQHGMHPRPGLVYVSPADREMTVAGDGSFVIDGSRLGRADPLLESCARVHGSRALAVILTGRLDDGARGALAIQIAGGRVLAQDRASSTAYGMPSATIATGCVDLVLPLDRIAEAITALAMMPGAAGAPPFVVA